MTSLIERLRRNGSRVAAGGVLLLVAASGTAAAHGGGTGGMMGGGWGGAGGWGGMGGFGGGLFGAGMLLWPLLLVALGLLVWAAINRSTTGNGSAGSDGTDSALAELRERYTRGDISDEEYESHRATLTG